MRMTLLSLILCVLSIGVQAIGVGEITSMMHSSQALLSKEITNPTDSARLISVQVVRIDTPLEGGKIIPMEASDELLLTPVRVMLLDQGSDNVKFFYNGPKDDKERYYRIQWTDQPVTEIDDKQANKQGIATTSAIINTILVVAPRKEKFVYEVQSGMVYNRGNVSFRVVAIGPCLNPAVNKDQRSCQESYYLMPRLGVKLVQVDSQNKRAHVGIWHQDDYITIK